MNSNSKVESYKKIMEDMKITYDCSIKLATIIIIKL